MTARDRPQGAGGRRRIRREKRTVRAMLDMYCMGNHGRREGLCSDCLELLEYANKRLDMCPFGEDKPACSKCPTHCYGSGQRERMRGVMRFSGPRMLSRHPLLAVLHMSDGLKRPGGRAGDDAAGPR